MISIKKTVIAVGCALFLAGSMTLHAAPKPAQAQAAPAAASRQLGTVKAMSGSSISLTTDAGAEIAVTVAEGARLVRTAPGQKDLTGATVISLQDIQVGDRILARGKASEDGKSLSASAIIVNNAPDRHAVGIDSAAANHSTRHHSATCVPLVIVWNAP